MKDFSIVVLIIFLGLLMTCCYMLALVNAENTQSQQHISVLWVTMQSNRITSSSPVKQRLPNSVWNRNVWYSWVQVMIWWPRWHMLNTHTHTNTSKSWLTHCFHPPPIVMPWLFEASQTLRQDMEGEGEIPRKRRRERERQIVVHDKQKWIYLLWLFKRKKQSLLIFCEISTELTLHAVTNLACPFYTSEVRELSEFIVVPGVFLCDSVTLEI